VTARNAADRAPARTHPEAARDRALTRLALSYIGAHPPAAVKATAWNTARMAEIDPVSRSILGAIVASPALGMASVAGFAILTALAAVGVVTTAARRAPLWLWTAPVLLWLSTAPFAVNFSRFRSTRSSCCSRLVHSRPWHAVPAQAPPP
jgi:hypothetical protein